MSVLHNNAIMSVLHNNVIMSVLHNNAITPNLCRRQQQKVLVLHVKCPMLQ
jgi:hypothetical protein